LFSTWQVRLAIEVVLVVDAVVVIVVGNSVVLPFEAGLTPEIP
jgi:hypothetical protein